MPKSRLSEHTFPNGYASSIPRQIMRGFMAYLSQNGILSGIGLIRAWKGAQAIATNIAKGSRQYFVTDGSFAGLGGIATEGRGSIFKVRNLLAFTGTGNLRFAGKDLGVSANSTLSYIRKVAGNYVAPSYQAGHARPSSQTIYPKSSIGAGHVGMTGSFATVIWRGDSVTGQTSLASLPSNVLVLNNGTFIQTFPLPDNNGQDFWGVGGTKLGFGADSNFYAIKTELGGEVLESTLSYSRTESFFIAADSENLNGANFTAADVGRRVTAGFTNYDTWITEVISSNIAKVKDKNPYNFDINENFTVRHAVEGILRAVEIHYSTESLVGQPFAPFDAFPPPSNLNFAGLINDTLFVETNDGIILVGVPTYIGSFPPKSALYPSEPAVLYLDGSEGLYWRFGKTSLSVISYIGGKKPLALQTVWKNSGIKYVQNAAIGYGGRIIAWSGKPVRLGAGRDPEIDFAFRVYRDFEGWDAEQTAEMPVACGYDGTNQLEIWAFKRKIMALHAPSGNWCSPCNITPYLTNPNDYIVSCVPVDNRLRITTNSGGELTMFVFDQGAGSRLVVQTPDTDSPLQHDTITEIHASVRVEANNTPCRIEVVKDYNDAAPLESFSGNVSNAPPDQDLRIRENIVNARAHSIRVELDAGGTGETGVQRIEVYGESSNVYIG